MKRNLLLLVALSSGCTLLLSNAFTARSCGDTLLDAEQGEQCDDGNNTNGDGCDGSCQLEVICGDNRAEPNEACDDGNNINGDGCRADCRGAEVCGDGFVDIVSGEQCDDNNTNPTDGCSQACSVEVGFSCTGEPSSCATNCGDNLAVGSEQCDDGNLIDGDLCEADCTLPVCGNNILDLGEACDDGNTTSGDGCNADCSALEICGNNIVDAGEACDDGNNIDGDTCEADCTLPVCGNNILDLGEACDDGNLTNGDTCEADCSLPFCGNGILDSSEVCDDGNVSSGDGCSFDCLNIELCGDGDLELGEACDDGNTTSGDGCGAACTIEVPPGCGNGVVDANEECDDSNLISDDGCSRFCIIESFTVVSLSSSNCQTFEHTNITGDDRGGLAVGSGRFLYTGDVTTTSFELENLSSNASFAGRIEAPASDLRTGKIYSLGAGGSPLGQGGFVTSLLELDPQSGNIAAQIDLSAPFNATNGSGIFSGRGRIVVLAVDAGSTFAHSIDPLTGAVTGGVIVANPLHQACENWAYWGIAEFSNSEISIIYTSSANTPTFIDNPPVTQILRTNLTTGATTLVSAFTDLADMCSLGVSPQKNRWYFHHEFTSEFVGVGGEEEFVGFCDAQVTF